MAGGKEEEDYFVTCENYEIHISQSLNKLVLAPHAPSRLPVIWACFCAATDRTTERQRQCGPQSLKYFIWSFTGNVCQPCSKSLLEMNKNPKTTNVFLSLTSLPESLLCSWGLPVAPGTRVTSPESPTHWPPLARSVLSPPSLRTGTCRLKSPSTEPLPGGQ